jgi:hypothetical protein
MFFQCALSEMITFVGSCSRRGTSPSTYLPGVVNYSNLSALPFKFHSDVRRQISQYLVSDTSFSLYALRLWKCM